MGAACSRAARVAARACRLDLFSACQFAETSPLLIEAVRHCPYAGTRNIRSRADYIGAHFHRGGGDRDRGIRDCRYRAAARQAGEQCGGNCNMKSTQIRGNQRQPPCPAARPPPASMAWKLLAPGGARPEDLQGVTRTYKCSQRLREACCWAHGNVGDERAEFDRSPLRVKHSIRPVFSRHMLRKRSTLGDLRRVRLSHRLHGADPVPVHI